jgi:hypothetical protein
LKRYLDIIIPDAEKDLVVQVLPLGLVFGAGGQLTQALTDLEKICTKSR